MRSFCDLGFFQEVGFVPVLDFLVVARRGGFDAGCGVRAGEGDGVGPHGFVARPPNRHRFCKSDSKEHGPDETISHGEKG